MNHPASLSILAVALLGCCAMAQATETAVHNDMDGDGRSDLVWRNASTGAVVYWSGANSAKGTSVVVNRTQNLGTGFSLASMAVKGSYSEYSGARAQLLTADQAGNYVGLQFDFSLGHGYVAYLEMAYPSAWSLAGTGDFGGDGDSEFVFRNTSTGQNMLSIWGWDARETWALASAPNLAWTIAGVADFDGDSEPDLLWRNRSTGQNVLWRSGNATTPLAVVAAGVAWKVAAIGDFNGDHRADIVWRNAGTGANVIWYSAQAATSQRLPAVADPRWQVTATGDFDGDGKSDLFWRHSATGANVIWRSANAGTRMAVTGVTNLAWTTLM